MKKLISKYLDDFLLLAGFVCVEVGLVQWNAIVAWVVGGIMLIATSVMIGKARSTHATD